MRADTRCVIVTPSQLLAQEWWLSDKNPPARAGDARGAGAVLGSGRPRKSACQGGRRERRGRSARVRKALEVRDGNPLQYSCLENAMD